jgi:hypothetical protein
LTITPGDTILTVDITPPSDNSVVDGYRWQYKRNSDGISVGEGKCGDESLSAWVNISSTQFVVSGLQNYALYTVYVESVNSVGDSGSTSLASSPFPAPSPPTFTWTPADSQVNVTITPPTDQSVVTGYRWQLDGASSWNSITATSFSVTGLVTGTAYTLNVESVNSVGNSSVVQDVVTPSTVPSAPTLDSLTTDSGTLTVNFTLNGNGGSSITNISYNLGSGDVLANVTSSPFTITGLTNNTVNSISIKAVNVNGSSIASNSKSKIVTGKIGKPGVYLVQRTASGYTLRIDWDDSQVVEPAELFKVYKGSSLFADVQ